MTTSTHSNHAVIFIVITVAIESIGFGIILPVLPELIGTITGETMGQSASYGGWLLFAYAIMQFFFAPVMGSLSDRFGRRPVLLLSLFVLGIDYIFMALAPTLVWLFVGRIIAGIAGSSYSTANAYIADISAADTSGQDKRAQNFGLIGAAFGVGFVIGPVIGGFLAEYGVRAPFYAAAVLSILNVVYGALVLKESLPVENRRAFSLKDSNPFGALLLLRQNPMVFGLSVALFFYYIAHVSLPAVWSYYTIEKFSWTAKEVGYSLGYAGVLMILVQAFLIRLVVPKLGTIKAGYIGFIAMIVGFLGYAFSTEVWQLYIALSVAALAGFVMPAFQAVMTKHVAANSQGGLQGAIACISSLTAIIGPLIMTWLFKHYTDGGVDLYFPGSPYFAAAILNILALVIYIFVNSKKAVV